MCRWAIVVRPDRCLRRCRHRSSGSPRGSQCEVCTRGHSYARRRTDGRVRRKSSPTSSARRMAPRSLPSSRPLISRVTSFKLPRRYDRYTPLQLAGEDWEATRPHGGPAPRPGRPRSRRFSTSTPYPASALSALSRTSSSLATCISHTEKTAIPCGSLDRGNCCWASHTFASVAFWRH